MITKTLKTGLFIIAIASFSFASAQEKVEVKKDRSERMFKHLDANADETITYEEFKAKRLKDSSKEDVVKKRFVSIDTDENGTINRAEFKVFFESKQKPKRIENQVRVQKKKNIEMENKKG